MKRLVPDFQGLAILDGDQKGQTDENNNGLEILYWQFYEIENYYITPDLILNYVGAVCDRDGGLFTQSSIGGLRSVIDDQLLESVFGGDRLQLAEYNKASSRLRKTLLKNLKMSEFAAGVFEEFARRQKQPVLLRKGEYYLMIEDVAPEDIPDEVTLKLDKLVQHFADLTISRL
jgi:hypothetical protein